MINLFKDLDHQDYLEIHLDGEGCQSVINALDVLRKDGTVTIAANKETLKEGFQIIPKLVFIFEPIEHFGDSDCTIWCRKYQQSVEMHLTFLGIEELHEIIEYVRTSGDHYHFIGGFNLFVNDGNENEIKAVNLYFD